MFSLMTLTQLVSLLLTTATQPPAPVLPRQEQQAVAYIRDQYPKQRVCVAPGRRPLFLSGFQDVLFALDHTYTFTYLDSVDQAQQASWKVRSAPLAKVNKASCDQEIVVSPRALSNLLVCEVFPAGDRTFTQTQVYLFTIKAQQVHLLRKLEVAYN
jgi:hypothetical protein